VGTEHSKEVRVLILFLAVLASLTPSERSLRGRMAAHHLHAQRDPRETTSAARAAFLSSFETKVDPKGELDPEDRRRRAEQLYKAHMAGLAFKAAKARRARAAKQAS
jgi:hypothetical protein